MKKLEGVIFDFDGTLVQSEDNYYQSDRQFLAGFGIEYTPAMHQSFVGMGNRNFIRHIQEKYGVIGSIEDLLIKKDQNYLSRALGKTKVFPEMMKLVQALYLQKLPMAIASGSSPQIISALIKDLRIEKYFSLVMSAEEVPRGKPEPDVFLEVSRRWHIPPANLLVLEDSSFGIQAARAAGMSSIALPYVLSPDQEPELRKADLFLAEGAQGFRAESILEWIDDNFCRCADCSRFSQGLCVD
jgi:HAD superfamily hydrolase (TIGR01509 family)